VLVQQALQRRRVPQEPVQRSQVQQHPLLVWQPQIDHRQQELRVYSDHQREMVPARRFLLECQLGL
jgi:hypothetical protein